VTFILKERRISVDNAAPYRESKRTAEDGNFERLNKPSWHLVMPPTKIHWCVNEFHGEEFISQLNCQLSKNGQLLCNYSVRIYMVVRNWGSFKESWDIHVDFSSTDVSLGDLN